MLGITIDRAQLWQDLVRICNSAVLVGGVYLAFQYYHAYQVKQQASVARLQALAARRVQEQQDAAAASKKGPQPKPPSKRRNKGGGASAAGNIPAAAKPAGLGPPSSSDAASPSPYGAVVGDAGPGDTEDLEPLPDHEAVMKMIMERADQQRVKAGDSTLTMEHMVLALAENPRFGEILSCAEGLDQDGMTKAIKKSRVMFNHTDEQEPAVEQQQTSLQKYARDLTTAAKEGRLDPVIGRSDEIRRCINILSRRTKNSPVLLGDSGVGKTALVEGLAHRIAAGDVPDTLTGALIMALDMGQLMAGAFFPGEFEERMKSVLKELTQPPPGHTYILFIDDIHTVTGPNAQQGGGVMDASVLIKPLLSRGELRCIGCTTLDKFRKFIEKDPALERRFQQLPIEAPSLQQTISILRGLRPRYEKHHGVRISDAALVAAAQLSERYVPDRHLPDKAIDLIDEATAKVKMEVALRPEALDRLDRRIKELDAERRLLRKRAAVLSDRHHAAELATIEAQLADLREQLAVANDRHVLEVSQAKEVLDLQQQLDSLDEEIETAEDAGDEALADSLRAGKRAELLKELKVAQQAALQAAAAQAKANGRSKGGLFNWRGSGADNVPRRRDEVNEPDVAKIISSWTGIPLTKLVESERDRLLHLGDELHRRIIGQDEAVEAVAEAIQRSRAGMKDPNGPIASFLFLGPTGVGKTELAKALAAQLFGGEEAMVRLDMSEYMEKHAVSKLIGAPPGYIGFDEGGQLTEQVRRRPYTVVLFDEVEKAHVDVFNLLLQILDDGRVTDSQGRVVSFKNVIIIMTSNLGSAEMFRLAGRTGTLANRGAAISDPAARAAEVREVVMEQVRKHFKPEFINRVDEFIIFDPLKAEQIHKIVRLRSKGVIERLSEKKMRLVFAEGAVQYLAQKGFDPVFGARPVKRAIQRDLETPLAKALLRGDFQEDDHIVVDASADGKSLFFKRTPATRGDNDEAGTSQIVHAFTARTNSDMPASTSSFSNNGGDASAPSATATTEVVTADVAASTPDVAVDVPAPARKPKFDPLRKISKLQASGVDLSKDGSAARSDESSLPPAAG